jgi:hypothetical protein
VGRSGPFPILVILAGVLLHAFRHVVALVDGYKLVASTDCDDVSHTPVVDFFQIGRVHA